MHVHVLSHVVVSKLKYRKAAGPDGLTAEHLKAGGVIIWLIVELEAAPDILH